MAKELFIENIRSAVSSVLPRVDAEHPYTERGDLERILRSDDTWLRGDSVKGFKPGDFKGLGNGEVEQLQRNVESFLQATNRSTSNRPPGPHQFDEAISPFLDIIEIVRRALLDEWSQAARQLTDQAEGWARRECWPTERHPWKLTERFLGIYELDRLSFVIGESQMALVPVGRFLMARGGSFDLAVMPAYESVGVVRGPSRGWLIKPLPGDNVLTRWGSQAFVEASERLSKMG